MIYKAEDRWNGNHLEHWGTKKNHRYIAKIGTGPNARYFYSQAELDAYRKGSSRMGIKQQGQTKMPGINIKNPLSALGRRAQAKVTRSAGEKQMSDLRKQQAERIRANEKRDADLSKLRSRFGKSNSQGTASNRANATKLQKQSSARSDRNEAFRKAATSQATDSARRQRAAMVKKRIASDKNKRLTRAAEDAYTKGVANKALSARAGRAARVAGYKAKFAVGDAKRALKRAANSSTVKKVKKKTKSTAKSAYNRGRSFVRNLFKRK